MLHKDFFIYQEGIAELFRQAYDAHKNFAVKLLDVARGRKLSIRERLCSQQTTITLNYHFLSERVCTRRGYTLVPHALFLFWRTIL